MLPVDAHTTALAPSSTAMEMAMVMPRSLKLPVGLAPSTFNHTSAPTCSERRAAGTRGVPPSSRVTTGVRSVIGRKARYSSMTPRQPAVTARPPRPPRPPSSRPILGLADDAEHAAHPVHRLVAAQLVDGGQQISLAGHVGQEDQPRLFGQADLLHGPDGNVVVPEDLGHSGQHTGPVGHVHAEVERGAHVVLRADGRARALGRRRGCTGEEVARRVDQVAQHGAGGRAAAGAAAVEHELAAHGALDEHGVEGAPHRRQRVRLGHHGGVHTDGDLGPAVDQLGDGEQLDGVSEPAGVRDVGCADRADALAVHVGVDDVAAERKRSQDGCFRRGVVPLDIRRGVALGQAELLGFAQHVVIAVAVLLHAGEDVVGRAVDDPHDPNDLLPRQ